MENLENLVVLEDTKQPVKKNLQSDGGGLGTIQHQTGNVKNYVWLNYLNLHPHVEYVSIPKFIKSCKGRKSQLIPTFSKTILSRRSEMGWIQEKKDDNDLEIKILYV